MPKIYFICQLWHGTSTNGVSGTTAGQMCGPEARKAMAWLPRYSGALWSIEDEPWSRAAVASAE